MTTQTETIPAVTDEMVNRFLGWKLPDDFNPDGGVSKREGATPVGTNLLTAVQARAMLEHVLGVGSAAAQHLFASIKRGDTEFELFAPHPAIAAMQPLDNDGKGLDLNDDTPLAPACDLSADGACEACQ